MRLNFKVHLVSAMLFTCMICLFSFAVCAQTAETQQSTSVLDWIQTNWAVIGLVLSEILAFMPTKAKGIAQSIFAVANAIFKKKSTLKSKSS